MDCIWSAIHERQPDALPFPNVLWIRMKPCYLFCPLDSIISVECQFISACAVCGAHIWDFNNLHAALWIHKQGWWRKSTTGLYFFIITLLKNRVCRIFARIVWQNRLCFCYYSEVIPRGGDKYSVYLWYNSFELIFIILHFIAAISLVYYSCSFAGLIVWEFFPFF